MTAPEDIAYRRQRVASLTREGRRVADIAAALGVTVRTIGRDRAALGIVQPKPPRLDDDELARAATLLNEGCSYEEVARTLGRSARAVKANLPGYGWTKEQVGQWAAFMHHHGGAA